jgi:hypothetical protein
MSMGPVTERTIPSRRGSYADQARDVDEQLTVPLTRPTLSKQNDRFEENYRWSGPWYSSTSAQQSRKANTGRATIGSETPRKLRRRRKIRGLSNDPSVSETKPPGQQKTPAVRRAPRSCDSLELGAPDDRLWSCDELSLILKRWHGQSPKDGPWLMFPILDTGIGGQEDVMDVEGVFRRLSVHEIAD